MMLRTATDSEVWKFVEEAREAGVRERGQRLSSGEPEPPAGLIAVEHAGELWRLVMAKAKELAPVNQGHTAGAYGSDGRSASVLVTQENQDGTQTVWHVESRFNSWSVPAHRWTVSVQGPFVDNRDDHWERLLAKSGPHAVVDHQWYAWSSRHSGQGFGGRVFRFRDLATSEEIEVRGPGHAGTIPPSWRERIPDTHEMVQGMAPGWMPVGAL